MSNTKCVLNGGPADGRSMNVDDERIQIQWPVINFGTVSSVAVYERVSGLEFQYKGRIGEAGIYPKKSE